MVKICSLRGCRQRRFHNMGWKAAVGVLCLATIILGTYIKFFDHPPASETLNANRLIQDIEKPSFIKKLPHSASLREHGVLLKNKTEELNSMKAVRKIDSNKTYSDSFENKTAAPDVRRIEQQDDSKEVHAGQKEVGTGQEEVDTGQEEVHAGQEEVDAGQEDTLVKDKSRGPHGIKPFDWENWMKENDFVNVGSLWGYCDDDDPPLIGKAILFNDGGSLTLTIVMNTTFEAAVTFGEVEIKSFLSDTRIYHKTFDLCEMAAQFEDDFFTCPMAKGDKYYFREQPISRFLPSGTYSVEMSLRNEYGNSIICGQCKFVI